MQAKTPENVAEHAVDAIQNILGLPFNTVFYYDEEKHRLQPTAWTSEGEALLEEIPSFNPGDSLAWQVFETGQSQVYADVGLAPERYNPETIIGSEIIIPLDDHGVLLIGSEVTNAFDESDVSLAKVVASHMTVALDRIEQEQELRRQNEQLDEFISVVTHDIRNPLNIAHGRIELARNECDSDHLESAAAAVDRSIELIDDLQTLAREGEDARALEVVSLETVAESCWQTVETAGATLIVKTDRTIRAEASRLKQLLENLFRNAVEHGGADVTVTVDSLPEGFYVADDGPGISEDERDLVFDPGYTTKADGTGYGLRIIQEIATAHGWTVCVTDSETGGARFEFRGAESS